MGRKRGNPTWRPMDCQPILGACAATEDYEVESDDGFDLVERIRTAQRYGRNAFLEPDVDFYG